MHYKTGFTLVELSIVLVIIGFIVGGILVAQSMIQTAKVQRLLNDISQYEIAISNFKMNYKFYPGDSKYFDPPGNEDNAIENASSGCEGAIIINEYNQPWSHISQASMLSKAYLQYSPISCTGTHNNNYNDSTLAGIVYPYTELDSKATVFLGQQKLPILLNKPSQLNNLGIVLDINANQVNPIESKLGSQNYTGEPQIGLVNTYGIGLCRATPAGFAQCSTSNAAVGEIEYFISPN